MCTVYTIQTVLSKGQFRPWNKTTRLGRSLCIALASIPFLYYIKAGDYLLVFVDVYKAL